MTSRCRREVVLWWPRGCGRESGLGLGSVTTFTSSLYYAVYMIPTVFSFATDILFSIHTRNPLKCTSNSPHALNRSINTFCRVSIFKRNYEISYFCLHDIIISSSSSFNVRPATRQFSFQFFPCLPMSLFLINF